MKVRSLLTISAASATLTVAMLTLMTPAATAEKPKDVVVVNGDANPVQATLDMTHPLDVVLNAEADPVDVTLTHDPGATFQVFVVSFADSGVTCRPVDLGGAPARITQVLINAHPVQDASGTVDPIGYVKVNYRTDGGPTWRMALSGTEHSPEPSWSDGAIATVLDTDLPVNLSEPNPVNGGSIHSVEFCGNNSQALFLGELL